MSLEKKCTLIYLAMGLILLGNCRMNDNKVFIKRYYKNGNIASYGWYVNNKAKVPVDTIHKFFENGNLSSVSVYDSKGSGLLDGISTLYHQNGNKYQVGNYVKGLVQGFYYQFDESGRLETKQFYFNDKPIGDHVEYDDRGMVRKYAFYWTDSVYACYIEYNENGMIKTGVDNRPVQFNYFTNVRTDTVQNKIQKVCKIFMIPSNPPKCRTEVNIYFYSQNGVLLQSDSISNVELYQQEYRLPDSLKCIKYSALQYDSISGKYYSSTFKTEL